MPYGIFDVGDPKKPYCIYKVDPSGRRRGRGLGCHATQREAHMQIAAIEASEGEGHKAVWTTEYINNLPDSAFLYIEPGGEKDAEGKTTPRGLRHLPYKDAAGKVDLRHVQNALSRLGQPGTGTTGGERWLTPALRERLRNRAKRILLQVSGKGE